MVMTAIVVLLVCGYFLWKQSVALNRIEKLLQDRYSNPFEDDEPYPDLCHQSNVAEQSSK
jgi:hypothetical protein